MLRWKACPPSLCMMRTALVLHRNICASMSMGHVTGNTSLKDKEVDESGIRPANIPDAMPPFAPVSNSWRSSLDVLLSSLSEPWLRLGLH